MVPPTNFSFLFQAFICRNKKVFKIIFRVVFTITFQALEWTTQPEFTCSNLTIETLEQGVQYVQS